MCIYKDDIRNVKFPYDKTVYPNWSNTQKVLRIFIDKNTGDDSNDGFSWQQAKKTMQGVYDVIKLLTNYNIIIDVLIGSGGDYGEFFWFNLPGHINITKPTSDLSNDLYYNNNEVKTFDDIPVEFGNLAFRDVNQIEIGGQSKNGFAYGQVKLNLHDYGLLDLNHSNIILYGVIFDEINTTGGFLVKTGNNSNAILYGCKSIGTSSSGISTKTGTWHGAFGSFEGVNTFTFKPLSFSPEYPDDIGGKALYLKNFSQMFSISDYNRGTFIYLNDTQIDYLDNAGNPKPMEFYINKTITNLFLNGSVNNFTFTGGTNPYLLHFNNNVIFKNLPTTNPGIPGALWNDSGTLKVS